MHRHALPPLPPGRVAPHSSVQTRFPDQTQERSHLTQSEIDLPRPTPEPDFHPLPWTSRSMGTQDGRLLIHPFAVTLSLRPAAKSCTRSLERRFQPGFLIGDRPVPAPEHLPVGVDHHYIRDLVVADTEVGAPRLVVLGKNHEGIVLGGGYALLHAALDHSPDQAGSAGDLRDLIHRNRAHRAIAMYRFNPCARSVAALAAESRHQDRGMPMY